MTKIQPIDADGHVQEQAEALARFLPPELRIPTLQSWYIGAGAFEDTKSDEVLTQRGTKVHYTTDDPKRELIERVVDEHILKSTGIAFDRINYLRGGSALPEMRLLSWRRL